VHRYLAPGGARHRFASLAHSHASLCAQAQDLFDSEDVKRDGAGAKTGKGAKGKSDAKGGKVRPPYNRLPLFPSVHVPPRTLGRRATRAGRTGSGSPATSGSPTIGAGRATRRDRKVSDRANVGNRYPLACAREARKAARATTARARATTGGLMGQRRWPHPARSSVLSDHRLRRGFPKRLTTSLLSVSLPGTLQTRRHAAGLQKAARNGASRGFPVG
jgi:hypothetical protein